MRVKAHDLTEQPQETWPYQIASLSEDRVGVPCAPFEPAVTDSERKAHVALLGAYTQILEEAGEVRIVALVEDYEPCVDWDGLVAMLDRYRTAVPADARLFLIDYYLVACVQETRRGKAGDAGPDDGNLHV